MAREDWRDREAERNRRHGADPRDRDDFGQADYSTDYAYDPHERRGYRADEDLRARGDDYGQADYTTDWAYDPERGGAYRRESADYLEDDRPHPRDRHDESRSWRDRASEFLGGGRRPDERRRLDDERRLDDRRRHRRRRGPSDRVLWAVIMERLEDERRLDLRDVDVIVEDGEVTLNGTVRHKDDKRRIEDIADVDGVRNVQNNLRLRDSDRGWTFF